MSYHFFSDTISDDHGSHRYYFWRLTKGQGTYTKKILHCYLNNAVQFLFLSFKTDILHMVASILKNSIHRSIDFLSGTASFRRIMKWSWKSLCVAIRDSPVLEKLCNYKHTVCIVPCHHKIYCTGDCLGCGSYFCLTLLKTTKKKRFVNQSFIYISKSLMSEVPYLWPADNMKFPRLIPGSLHSSFKIFCVDCE